MKTQSQPNHNPITAFRFFKNPILQFVILTNIFFSLSCQKEIKLENLPNSNLTTNSVTLNQSEIQEFIDSVNAVHIRQSSSDQIGLNSALSLME